MKTVEKYYSVKGKPAVEKKIFDDDGKLVGSMTTSVSRDPTRVAITKVQYDALVEKYNER